MNGKAFGRAGVMQQAVVVDVQAANYDTVEVLVEGMDGQLPKLDTFQLLSTLSWGLGQARLVVREAYNQPKLDTLEARLRALSKQGVSEWGAGTCGLCHNP